MAGPFSHIINIDSLAGLHDAFKKGPKTFPVVFFFCPLVKFKEIGISKLGQRDLFVTQPGLEVLT